MNEYLQKLYLNWHVYHRQVEEEINDGSVAIKFGEDDDGDYFEVRQRPDDSIYKVYIKGGELCLSKM
ncbi:hypothetical protein BC476_06005 [Vibrio parahaemolyticus]|uniref:hypothetical protein n=1 Tax=Vibrio parahaemolyticus TaxID=670 RepID=UPI00083A091B|nr:hypothetical protein [Vibrio parahaemolyticus]ODA49493.1 hypothetical protein BC476_06005 [Vibrio parahaemolyticus]